MRIMLSAICLLASFTLTAPFAQADEADDIVASMNYSGQIIEGVEPLLPTMSERIVAQMRQSNPAYVQRIETQGKGGIETFKAIFSEEFMTAMQAEVPMLDTQIATTLREKMGKKDLRKVRKFVKSKAGKQFFDVFLDAQNQMQQFGKEAGQKAGNAAFQKAIERSNAEQF